MQRPPHGYMTSHLPVLTPLESSKLDPFMIATAITSCTSTATSASPAAIAYVAFGVLRKVS